VNHHVGSVEKPVAWNKRLSTLDSLAVGHSDTLVMVAYTGLYLLVENACHFLQSLDFA
jgi:hypothetical protein